MYTLPTLVLLGLYSSVALAQRNITVVDTDPSIQYQGGAGDVSICKVDPNGTVMNGQAGCYNVPNSCASSVAMGQSKDSGASFTFKGSAIYINSLLFSISPLYTVTLDGTPLDVDGFRSSRPFVCDTLFARTGLDPTVDHSISLTIKGVSPSSNETAINSDIFTFSLINFIYTVDDSTSLSNSLSAHLPTSTGSAATTSASPGTTASVSTSSDSSTSSTKSSAAIAAFSSRHAVLGSVFALIPILVSCSI